MELVFQECVHKVKNEGKAVLLSSHILSEVEKLCDKLTIIRNGKIIDTGTLKELRHLSRNNVTVETKTAIAGIEKLEGVYDVARNSDEVSFKVDAEATGSVMKRLADADISHIIVTPPTLEELFISHYGAKQ
jgi:ABC-2 type transport system ATP-binding protein